jgi:hypothetical protein
MLVAASTPACEYRQRLASIVAERHAAVCFGTSAAKLTALDQQVSACLRELRRRGGHGDRDA